MEDRSNRIRRLLDEGDVDGVNELAQQTPLSRSELLVLAEMVGLVGAIDLTLGVGGVDGALLLARHSPLSEEELGSLSVSAADDKYLPLLRWLLDAYPDSLRKPNHEGSADRRVDNLLHIACFRDQPDAARLLVERYGADPAATIVEEENCPLNNACRRGNVELVRFLLDRGAPPNSTANGCHASYELIAAAHKGHLDVVKLLVQRGALFNAPNALGMTPLVYARMGGNSAVVEFLESVGATEPGRVRDAEIPEPAGEPRSLSEFLRAADSGLVHLGDADLGEADRDWPVTLRLFGAAEGTMVATDGMSSVPLPAWEGETEPLSAELYAHVPAGHMDAPADHWPEDWPEQGWVAEWLVRLARYPAQAGERLERATLFANGEPPTPLAVGVPFTCWLLVCYPDKAISEWKRPYGKTLRLFHAFPLHTAERDFGRRRGVGALLRKLSKAGVSPLIDPARESVV